MSAKTKRYKDLQCGSIVEVPVGDRLAYIFSVDYVWFWLYKFTTNRRPSGLDCFASSRWKLPFLCMEGVPIKFKLVGEIPVTPEMEVIPTTWVREVSIRLDADTYPYPESPPGPIRAFSNERGNWYITEEESRSMFEMLYADGDNLPGFIERFLPELERLDFEDDGEAAVLPDITPPVADPLDEEVVLEIRAPECCEVDRDAVEDELDEALGEAEVGDLIGAGGGTVGNWDLAVSTPLRDLRKVLRVVRRVLRAMEMPVETEIVEQSTDRPEVVHPLVVPPKKSGPG